MTSPLRSRPQRSRRSAIAVICGGTLAVLIALAVAACSSATAGAGLSEDGEALTTAQAEQLASARFALGSKGPFSVTVRAGAADDIDHFSAALTVDGSERHAWGTLSDGPASLQVDESVAFSSTVYASRRGEDPWQIAPIEGIRDPRLLLLLSLSADRPENAQLLRQSDTRFLGDAVVDGRRCQVYRLANNDGVSTKTRLWVDEETGALHRLDGGNDTTFVITADRAAPAPAPSELEQLLSVDGVSGGGETGDG